jgi:hypothetical protein
VPTHSLKARALILCLTLWLPVTAVVWAGGQPEARLSDVERLIQQQDYSGALKLLATIQRKDPNLRDETSRLMTQIMVVMQNYNAVLEELGKAIEAGDVAKMQVLIPELHRIDPARAAGMTGQAEVLLGFLKLMNRAYGLLQDGKAADALALYLLPLTDPEKAGVTLPLSQFEAAGYGEIIVASVKRATAGIVTAAREEQKSAPALPAILPAVQALLALPSASESTAQDRAAQFDATTAPLLQAAAAEGLVRDWTSSIAEISRSIQLSSDKSRVNLYLRYLVWLCRGRESRTEGIAPALRLLWAGEAQQMADATNSAVTAVFESARAAYESGGLAAADAAFAEIPSKSILAARAAALVSARFGMNAASGWKLSDEESRAMKEALGRALVAQEYAAESRGYRLLIVYRKDLDAMPAAPSFSAGADASSVSLAAEAVQLASARVSLARRASEAQLQDAAWSARGKAWESKADVIDAAASLGDSAVYMSSLFRAFAAADLRSRDVAYALRIAFIGGAAFPKRLDDAVALRTRAEDLKDGTVNGQLPSGTGLAVKHPDQAIEVLKTADGNLDSLIADIVAHEQKLQSDNAYVKAAPEFTALFEGSSERRGYNLVLQTAQAEKTRITTLSASALRQVDDAALASREGDNNFAQAQAALARGDPDGAASALEPATAAYLRSLTEAYTDHAANRTTRDRDEINGQIVNLQNKLSVDAAQKAVTAINKLIVVKDFLGASDSLDTAVRAWSQNQEASYPPFDNLRLTIQAAVELSQGREISWLDAKADVVNAFIKNAQDNLAAGKLADATQNVKDALAVAPNYGAAKVLQLMIKKQTDPAGFQKDAMAQIATYMRMGADTSNIEGQKTAYLALLDYSKLDPKFAAQTRGTIQELEYALGLARRPPTAQQIAQSTALVQQANVLQQQGTQEAYQGALDLLKQALHVNPDSTDAVRLDGLIRTKMGSTALAALSPADTQAYNESYSLFLSGAYQDAYDKVMGIWNDARSPRNKTYGPLLRLKKRLEVQLNIS